MQTYSKESVIGMTVDQFIIKQHVNALDCYKQDGNLYIKKGYNLKKSYKNRKIENITSTMFEVDGFYDGWFRLDQVKHVPLQSNIDTVEIF
jgi:hypothetical protein